MREKIERVYVKVDDIIEKYTLPGQYIMPPNVNIHAIFSSIKNCMVNNSNIVFPEQYHFHEDSLHQYKSGILETNLESVSSDIFNDFNKLATEAYMCDKENCDDIIKKSQQDILCENELINNVIKICDDCIINVHHMAQRICTNNNILNDINKLSIYLFDQINKTSKIEFYELNYLMNIKNTNEQGKHVTKINTKNKFTVSSTVLKEQMKDNKIFENKIYAKLKLYISTEENQIIECVRSHKKDDQTFYTSKQNKYLQIILNNYTLICIKEHLLNYLKFLETVSCNLQMNPNVSTCPDIIIATQILQNQQGHKLIYKLNDEELKNLHWNHNKGEIIFDEIYLVNMYDHQKQMYFKPMNSNQVFNGFGYAIARSQKKKKWNIFPSDDERMNYNNKLIERYDDLIYKYVILHE